MAVARSQDLGPERWAEKHPSDLLLAEFIHRAANDFAIASIEVCNASKLASYAAVQDHLELVGARLQALASIQRLLQPPGEAPIHLGDRLCELCHYYAEARFAGQGAFVRLRTVEAWADPGPGWALLLIVSELLTNAARHAFRAPGGLVEIELARDGDMIRCEIADNGVGIGQETAARRGGTALIAELARSADIAFVLQPRDRGSGFELRLACSG
ncbi:MAG: sensor histidine kinase [Sphingomonas sp.]|uniref:ATP-binding protein n=1 Tax=Sphingomonas sp. TaxID=28214 RepID=UPI002276A017|nr:sensor histidine kinase [Sphingomonas sp.]MCX8478022.1 sensor histidine kinase [Sphingomonas sp.]